MRLNKKVLLLWNTRILCLSVLAYPVAHNMLQDYPHSFALAALCITAPAAAVSLLLFIRYLFIRVSLSHSTVTVEKGFLLRRTTVAQLCHICALRTASTPLSEALGIESVILYCEGFTLILPENTKDFSRSIRQNPRGAKSTQ